MRLVRKVRGLVAISGVAIFGARQAAETFRTGCEVLNVRRVVGEGALEGLQDRAVARAPAEVTVK
jgi:hypothetical protein